MPSGYLYDTESITGNVSDYQVSSFDLFMDRNVGTVVYALNRNGASMIGLQRVVFNARTETEEIIADTDYQNGGLVTKALSSNHSHVVIWQYKEETQSKLVAQVYDRKYAKIGSEIDITEFKPHSNMWDSYFTFDAAIDSVGKFFVVWEEYGGANIVGKKFDTFGNVIREEFNLNASPNINHDYPIIAANQKGEFVAAWRTGNGGPLSVKIMDENSDTGATAIGGCCGFQQDYTNLRDHQISINDHGKVVYAYRNGYYDVSFLVFNKSFEVLRNTTHRDIIDTESKFEMRVSNTDNIVLVWNVDGNTAGVKVQRYDGLASQVGNYLLLDNSIERYRIPSLAMNGSGKYCVMYKDRFPTQVYYIQRFHENGTLDGPPGRMNTFLSDLDTDMSLNSQNEIFTAWRSSAFGSWNTIVKGYLNTPDENNSFSFVDETIWEGDSLLFCSKYLKKPGIYSCDLELPEGIQSTVLTLQVFPDLAPAKPTGLIAYQSNSNLELLWEANTETDLKEYNVYRNSTDDASGSSKIVSTSNTFYNDDAVDASVQYFYWIRAVDVRDNISEFSNSAIALVTGIDPEINSKLLIFPNPCSDRIFVELPEMEAIQKIEVVDVMGKMYGVQDLEDDNSVSLEGLRPGIYFVKVQGSRNRYNGRILKR